MNFQNSKRNWKATLAVCLVFFLAGCTPGNVMPGVTSSPATPPPATPSPVPTQCPIGNHVEELISGGQVRQYRLHVPSSYQPEKPAALVLGFHGAGSSAATFESYSGFNAVSDREGFIVVYPDATEEYHAWHSTPGPGNPDIDFARDLIEAMLHRCNIDPNRVYASGHSNGGGLSNRLACDLADHIAAIGTVAGAYEEPEDCYPSQPVAVFSMHGTADPIITYDSFRNMNQAPATYSRISMPIPQWASAWAIRNGCDPHSSEVIHEPLISEMHWSGCRAQADVILYSIEGGGHEWPGKLMDVAQTIWDFFVQHSS
jgi:polyhydroxybutyrate depolymerase